MMRQPDTTVVYESRVSESLAIQRTRAHFQPARTRTVYDGIECKTEKSEGRNIVQCIIYRGLAGPGRAAFQQPKTINLSIRCILGDIRLWVGDTSTSSCLVYLPRGFESGSRIELGE